MPTLNAEPEPSAAPPGLEKHDRVRHREFGRGFVVKKVMGERYLVFFLQDGKRRELKENTLERCS